MYVLPMNLLDSDSVFVIHFHLLRNPSNDLLTTCDISSSCSTTSCMYGMGNGALSSLGHKFYGSGRVFLSVPYVVAFMSIPITVFNYLITFGESTFYIAC